MFTTWAQVQLLEGRSILNIWKKFLPSTNFLPTFKFFDNGKTQKVRNIEKSSGQKIGTSVQMFSVWPSIPWHIQKTRSRRICNTPLHIASLRNGQRRLQHSRFVLVADELFKRSRQRVSITIPNSYHIDGLIAMKLSQDSSDLLRFLIKFQMNVRSITSNK